MINKSELMIGDWVAVRILSQLPTYEKRQWTAEDYTRHLNIEPILLTSEILEKNGFVNDSSYDECVADGHFVTIQIWSYSAENVLIQWDGITCDVINDIGCPCEKITIHGKDYEHDIYVHELQHALRMVRLNDIADNFKI